MTTAARSRLIGRWQTRSPFWWQGPNGSKILMAYTRQYSNLWFICGLPPHEAGCRESLPVFFQTFESPGYQPDTVLMFGSQLENTDLIPGEGEFVPPLERQVRLAASPTRHLPRLFRARSRRPYGAQLETVRGDFGPYWEDGIGTDAQYAALYRHTESRAPAVETLASLAALAQPEWAPPLDRLHRLWTDLILYAEHTYTSSGGYSRPESDESVARSHQALRRGGRPRNRPLDRPGIHEPADGLHPYPAARPGGFQFARRTSAAGWWRPIFQRHRLDRPRRPCGPRRIRLRHRRWLRPRPFPGRADSRDRLSCLQDGAPSPVTRPERSTARQRGRKCLLPRHRRPAARRHFQHLR